MILNASRVIFQHSKKRRAWDLVHPGQNRDVREIQRNLISRLENWEIEKNYKLKKIKTPTLFKKKKKKKNHTLKNYVKNKNHEKDEKIMS